LEATSVESIRKQFETNVVGLLATMRAVVPGMRKRRSGVVVNVGSIAGKITYPLPTS
jgi:NADP-dependent 3-hydroxy acid dehydrogenase YdfG